MTKQTAKIDNWVFYGHKLYGQISDHPSQNDFKKKYQQTSPLTFIDCEKGVAITKNTIYTLGRPSELTFQEMIKEYYEA